MILTYAHEYVNIFSVNLQQWRR